MMTARNVFWVICVNRYPMRAGWLIRYGAGSSATAGHQKSSAPTRNSPCSNWWTIGSSREALKSGEKWTAHIIAANMTHATTGWATIPTGREWRIGSHSRCRVSGELTRRISVIGAARAIRGAATSISRTCWTMCTENSEVS